jgi:hypothetical protein
MEEHLEFKGLPFHEWNPPEMRSPYPLHIAPDFWRLGTGRGAFAAGPKALAIGSVNDILLAAGQLLPLPFNGQELMICNILECVDCIDEDKSEWQLKAKTNIRLFPTRPFFEWDWIPRSTLFKIPQCPWDIFTWEHHYDPESEFKACVEANKLTGLKFEPMWSQEEGIIPYKHPVS